MAQYSSEEVLKFLESKKTYRLNQDWYEANTEAESWEHHITCPICETINRVQNKEFTKRESELGVKKTGYKIGRNYKLWQKVLGSCVVPVGILLLLIPTGLLEIEPNITFMLLLMFVIVPFLCITYGMYERTPIYKVTCESCETQLFIAHRPSSELYFPRIAILTVKS